MAKVVTVDTAKNELAVKDEKGEEKTMAVGPTTKITKEGKDIALSDIKSGDRVMYELDAASNPPVVMFWMTRPALTALRVAVVVALTTLAAVASSAFA